MELLHQAATDVLSVRLHVPSRVLPPSRHELLCEAAPPAPASVRPPACQGTMLQLLVRPQHEVEEEAATNSTPIHNTGMGIAPSVAVAAVPLSPLAADPDTGSLASLVPLHPSGAGVRLRPARVSTWTARDWANPSARVGLEWVGVELGNVLPVTRASPAGSSSVVGASAARLQWCTQGYLVRDGPAEGTPGAEHAERALDSSLALRWRCKAPAGGAPALLADPALLSAHLTAHAAVVTNLGAAAQAKIADAPPKPWSSMMAATMCLGFESAKAALLPSSPASSAPPSAPRLSATNHWRAQVFGASDGLLLGGSVLQSFQHRSHGGDVIAALESMVGSPLWPASLPRLQLGASRIGLEGAYVNTESDFTAALGLQQQFRWRLSDASKARQALLAPSVPLPAVTDPTLLLPPSTLSFSASAMGHVCASLHVPLTRGLSAATHAHVQITNGESALQLGARLALNDYQTVGLAVDSQGGVRAALQMRRRRNPRDSGKPVGRGLYTPFAWMAWLSRHATVQLHAQAFPLLPALAPHWNAPQTSVMGNVYSSEAAIRLRTPQLHVGGSVAVEFGEF